MQSFAFNSPEFIKAVIKEGTKEKYQMELNATDFKVFVTILSKLSDYAYVSYKDIPEIEEYGELHTEPIQDWAELFLSSVAESLNVEGI